jgi:tetratricopeptide (TPR) repeat protein
MTGRLHEAMMEIEKAMELDPLSLPINADLAELLYFSRQYDLAIEKSWRALEMDPYYFRVHLNLGRALLQKGLLEEAIGHLLEAKGLLRDNPGILGALGQAYAVSGKRKQALKVLEELQELSQRRYVSPYDFAVVYAALGEKDQALQKLLEADEERAQWMIFIGLDPRLDSLRADPRFLKVMQRVGL